MRYSDVAAQLLPDHPDCAYNAIFAAYRLRRLDEAAERARAAIARFGDQFVWHNILSTILGTQGRLDESRAHGTKSLALKDALTKGVAGHALAAVPVPVFDAHASSRQIISFSLYGTHNKYLDGAVHNARAARYLYPGWRCRFFVDDSVPEMVLKALQAQGAQIAKMNANFPAARWGTLWRFFVADDAQVQRYMLRDADSVLNLREAVAVHEWLASGKHFHVMRDHFDHSELVLAGLWGGVRGALPELLPLAQAFLNRGGRVQPRTADQEFLREVLWPSIRQSVLVHDSQFSFGERQPFPAHAWLPPGHWVGGPAAALVKV